MSNGQPLEVGRGEIAIQPAYFTSSLFVHPLREDILLLISIFTEQYALHTSEPFSLFKTVWRSQGWPSLHWKVLTGRAREALINTTFRLFLEPVEKELPPLSRVVGLFGLYTFFFTQPSKAIPPLQCISQIPIAIDTLKSLSALPQVLSADIALDSLRPHVICILSKFISTTTFHVLPRAVVYPYSTRSLPREIVHKGESDDLTVLENQDSLTGAGIISIPKRKGGRPSKQARILKGKTALKALNKWLDKSSHVAFERPIRDQTGEQYYPSVEEHPQMPLETFSETHVLLSQRPVTSLRFYQFQKTLLLNHVLSNPPAEQPLHQANAQVASRFSQIAGISADNDLMMNTSAEDVLNRVQEAIQNGGVGLLGLLDGTDGASINSLQESLYNNPHE